MNIQGKYHFVFLHGFEGTPYKDFWPWLKSELEKQGHTIEAPQLPNTNSPDVNEQVAYVLTNCRLDENTILVGHSLGGVVANKVIEQLRSPIAGFIHVASPINTDFKDGVERPIIFDWQFNFEKIKKQAGVVVVISDVNDFAVPVEHARTVTKKLGARLIITEAVEPHFCAAVEPIILDAISNMINKLQS
jgi:predicted alpha/beta hydrolase family esterase